MRKGRKTRLFALLLSLAMLFSSVSVFAAEKPEKAANPTWGDIMKLDDYVESILGDEFEWILLDGWDMHMTHWNPPGTIIIRADVGAERWGMAEEVYWEEDGSPKEKNPEAPLTGDALTNYSDYYDLCIELIDTMGVATGEYYFEYDEETEETVDPLWIAFEAARDLANSVYDLPLRIMPDDTESVDEDVMWVRQSDWDAFHAAMEEAEAILSAVDWDITRAQAQELIERYTNIFNTLNAAIENGNLTPETPSDTPETPAETPETSSKGTETPKASDNSATVATGTATVAAAVAAIPTTSSVNGVKSTVSGAFAVTKVNGVAFTTPLADIVAGYGIASGEKAYAKVWDLDPKKSNLAHAVIENAAAALGAEVGPGLQLELGKMSSGKYSLLSQDGSAVTIKVGVPASFVEQGKTLAVVRVRPGGAVSILADQDADANTVTFTTTGGAGAYAIVKY